MRVRNSLWGTPEGRGGGREYYDAIMMKMMKIMMMEGHGYRWSCTKTHNTKKKMASSKLDDDQPYLNPFDGVVLEIHRRLDTHCRPCPLHGTSDSVNLSCLQGPARSQDRQSQTAVFLCR